VCKFFLVGAAAGGARREEKVGTPHTPPGAAAPGPRLGKLAQGVIKVISVIM